MFETIYYQNFSGLVADEIGYLYNNSPSQTPSSSPERRNQKRVIQGGPEASCLAELRGTGKYQL